MRLSRFLKPLLLVIAACGLAAAGYFTRETWLPWVQHARPAAPVEAAGDASTPATKVIVSDQALNNLAITSKPLTAQTIWKTVTVPGMVVDRPGVSDRGVIAPVSAIVSDIKHVAGDTVKPGDVLFTLRLLSESLHQTQTDLFKATQDIKLAGAQKKRLEASEGAIPRARVIEVDNQITRLEVASRAYRQELLNRGLTPEDIESVARGNFVSTISVAAPERSRGQRPLAISLVAKSRAARAITRPLAFEVQELKVELGQQVQAGQTLCLLANHQSLSIEGRAFRDDLPLLARSFEGKWPVAVDFQEDEAGWSRFSQTLTIRHIANTIDPVNRTFAFLLPLENESRPVEREEGTQLLWRFRPGQKVWLKVRVEEVKNVFVLPPDAVTRDGPEAFVFSQNVNTFEKVPVRVLFQERDRVVIANDGSLPTYPKGKEVWTIPAIARTAAAQLNRMTRAGTSGVPRGYHIHADGSLHKNEDEGK